MSQGRRTIDRRRRILYSAQSDPGPSTAASRREAARLREARSPATAYGSKVHRRLRGRWFALVPVRRRTLSIVVASLMTATFILCAAHYAAVTWPWIANHSDIARPLRLDRPDSFGRWFAGMLMIGSAGASFLIYQLRRHRLDDFHGHYRLWRLVLIVMMLASLNSVVGLIDWTGALLDAAVGRRVAFSGADWIRIVVSVGGAILTLRLIAEVHRSRAALAAMLVAAGFFAIPEAVKWNVMQDDTIGPWVLARSAPLIAFTALFISFGIYLRMLYRQVRRLDETDTLKDRFQQMRLRLFEQSDVKEASEPESNDAGETKTSWWKRKQKGDEDTKSSQRKLAREARAKQKEKQADEKAVEPVKTESQPVAKRVVKDVQSDGDESQPKEKRRWFGLRAAKTEAQKQGSDAASEDDAPSSGKKRKRFSLRLDPHASKKVEPASKTEQPETEEPKPKRRFGLAGFRRQKAEEAELQQDRSTPSDGKRRSGDAAAIQQSHVDPESIDWDSLNKSERRRLRKQLKRQNNAA